MPTLKTSFRAPADSRSENFISFIQKLLTGAADFLLPCRHRRVSMPYNERQRCLDCGASRLYYFDSDFAHGNAGIQTGAWQKDEPFPTQSARRIARRQVNLRGIALRPLDGRAAILNPGAESPLFQPRPRRQTVTEWIGAQTNDVYSRHERAVNG